MSNGIYHHWDFNRDLAALVGRESTTLETLNEQMLKVDDPEARMTKADQRTVAELAGRWTQGPSFVPLRLAELFHGARLEHNDNYVLAAVGHLGGRSDTTGIRTFMLTHDHYLRENVFWRFFEVEGGGEISLANIDKFSSEDGSWKAIVVDLVDDGVLDRDRTMRSCLEALNRDFSSYRAGWFSRLYDALKPNAAEAGLNQDQLLRLMASANTATVALAVRQLAVLHQAGMLDSDRFVRQCSPAVAGSKASALKVLGILGTLASTKPWMAGGAGFAEAALFDAAATGLAHPHRDVQHAAATLLVKHQRTALLEAGLDSLSPAMAAQFMPRAAAATQPQDPMAAVGPAPPRPEPASIWTDDEALERFAALLENPNDAIEFELALAWLAAHEASAVLQPLARRAAKLNDPEGPNENIMVDLVLAATDPGHVFRPGNRRKQRFWASEGTPNDWPEDRSVVPVFHKRVREVVEILQNRGERRTLLATPTESCGWVDPAVLVRRFLDADAAGLACLHFDAIIALLRVGPDGRAGALATLQSSGVGSANAAARNALAYALGGPAQEIENAPWWVAAARARAPRQGDEHLRAAGLMMPGQADPATLSIRWEGTRDSYEQRGKTHHYTWWTINMVAGPRGKSPADFPTVIPSRTDASGEGSPLDYLQIALAVPASTLPFAAASMLRMKRALDSTSPSGEDQILAALENHPGIWHEATAELLALALASQRTDIRIRAAELFAAAVPDRLAAREFAIGMANCAAACTLSRWAGSLADAASISGRAAGAVTEVLGRLLPALEHGHHGIGKLMSVLLDESVRLAKTPQDLALREWLTGFTGSSAAARTARQLLAL